MRVIVNFTLLLCRLVEKFKFKCVVVLSIYYKWHTYIKSVYGSINIGNGFHKLFSLNYDFGQVQNKNSKVKILIYFFLYYFSTNL